MEFDNLNTFLMEKGDKLFDTSNRSLKYGDGIFETMRLLKGKIMFWDDHYARLERGLKYLKIDNGTKGKDFWEKEIERLVVKNHYTEARIKLTVYRDSPGLYTPMGNRLGFILEGLRYDNSNYNYAEEDASLDVFEQDYKSISPLSNLKTTSALLFVLASIEKKEKKLGELVVLNTAKRVCEGTASNIFIRIGDDIHTPSLEEGCLDGVMRKQIINYFKQKNSPVLEGEVSVEMLKNADEIFLTNTISGVQSIGSFKGKKLNNTVANDLQNYLKYLVSQITPKNLF